MKLKNPRAAITRPLIIGVIALAFGIGMVFYYRASKDATAASYVVCGLIIFGGLVGLVGSIIKSFQCYAQMKIMKKGRETIATFLRYDTKMSTSKTAIYYIEYEYDDENNQLVHAKSGSDFTWEEVLSLKSAKEFHIKYLGKRIILTENIEVLKAMHVQEMQRLQALYNKAYTDVDKLKTDSSGKVATRYVVPKRKKKDTEKISEEDKPLAKDE